MTFGDTTIEEGLNDSFKCFGKVTVNIRKKVANNAFRASETGTAAATKCPNGLLAEIQ